jgi:arylsulfatase A-like enzyme
LPKQFHVDAFVGDQAAAWLSRHGREPFAAWVSFPGPHDPYDPPAEMAGMYDDAPIPAPLGSADGLAHKPRAQQRSGPGPLNNPMFRIDPSQATAEHYRRWRAHYYANISLIDEGIGKILAALDATNALDRTLIIFTSDHGDALGDHGLSYKGFFYDSMARVPLLIRGPGVVGGARCHSLVSLLDLVPLMYSACGVEPPSTLEGIDLSPVLHDPSQALRDVVFSEVLGRVMVRNDRYKYAFYADGDSELYDLATDPTEERNLVLDQTYRPEVVSLQASLLEHTLRTQHYRAMSAERPQEPPRLRIEAEYQRERSATTS